MNCPQCNWENRETQNFCKRCGARLPKGPTKWYLKKSFVLILLLLSGFCLFPIPFVLIFLLYSPEFSKRAKTIVSALSLIWMISLISTGTFLIHRKITSHLECRKSIVTINVIFPGRGEVKKIMEEKTLIGFPEVTWSSSNNSLLLNQDSLFSRKFRIINPGTNLEQSIKISQMAYSYAWSPDGTKIAFSGQDQQGDMCIFVSGVKAGNIKKISSSEKRVLSTFPSFTFRMSPEWSSDGAKISYLITRFSRKQLAIYDFEKSQELILDELSSDESYSWCPIGEQIAYLKKIGDNTALVIRNTGGREKEKVLECRGNVSDFDWSPRGNKISYVVTRGESDELWVLNIGDMKASRLAPEINPYRYYWSPDEKRIAFTSSEYSHKRDEIISWEIVSCDGHECFELRSSDTPVFSPVEAKIAYVAALGKKRKALCLLDFNDGTTQNAIERNSYINSPTFSPEGDYIAYNAWMPEVKKYGIFIYNRNSRKERQFLTSCREFDMHWSFDGSMLAVVMIEPVKK